MSIGNLSKRKGGFGAGYIYNFKGTVGTFSKLPLDPDFGDIYKISSTGQMVIWDGNDWSDLTGLRGEKGEKGDPGEPFEDLGLLDEESLWPVLDWLFEDGLYKYTEAGDGGTKTTYVFVNGNDTQGGGCRQTFLSSDGSIKYRICPYKEDVWHDFVPYVTDEDLEDALSQKADKKTSGGGFVGGNGAFASSGGAAGNGAIAGEGFSGGYNAKAATMEGYSQRYIDAIQLGTGTNQNEKTLQVYNYQLLDANGKIPAGRLPDGSGLNYKGEANSFSDLPQSPSEGDVYQLKMGGIFCNSTHSDLLTGSFDEYFDDVYGDGSVYNFQNGIDNHPELSVYFTNPSSPLSYIYTSRGEYLCDTTYDQPGGHSKDFYAPIMTGEDTVAFYLSPVDTAIFYTVGDLGLVFYHDGGWYPVSDVGWIKIGYYTKEEVDENISAVDLWGGNVTDVEDLPASPAPGTYCYVENNISNGVKYTGIAENLFNVLSNEYPNEILPLGPIKFTVEESYVKPREDGLSDGYVCIYDANGVYVGELDYNPTFLPMYIRGEKLGISDENDTVTFYLGIYDGESFPERVYDFCAGSLIVWDGNVWHTVPTKDSVEKIPAARLPMDILAPYFERTGSEVSCYPVDGGVFDVVSHVTLKQDEGTPSFENPLPISGFDSITLTANGTEFSVNLGQTVYGGTFDWNSGTLTVTYTKEVLDGTRAYSRHSSWDSTDTYCFYVRLKKVGKRPIYESGVCDKLSNIGSDSNKEGFLSTNDRTLLYIKISKEKLLNEPTGDNLKAYLSENPIEFCYDIEPAEIVSLTPQEISVLSGENVFSSDCGETTVKCNEQVTAVINRLSERIAQLEAAGN